MNAMTAREPRRFRSTRTEPYERGREFGAAHATRVGATVDFYRALLARCPRPGVDLVGQGERVWAGLRVRCPGAAAEIAGIADGAGLPVAAIAGLNARTEILSLADPDGAVECSILVATGDGTAEDHVLGAQTWDWYDGQADNWLEWTVPLPSGGALTTVTEYGILGKIGVNSSGVGVLFSILHHDRDGTPLERPRPSAVPLHVLTRLVLERAVTMRHAVTIARGRRVAASSTLTLLDRSGAVALELFPDGSGLVPPSDGVLAHTNHFLTAEGAGGCRAYRLGANSRVRLRSLRDAVRGGPPRSEADLLAALSVHDPDGPACVHADGSGESTLATVVIDPVAHRLRVWPGAPCAVEP